MKKLLAMSMMVWAASASAASIKVSEKQIEGKTNLVAVANRVVNGKPERMLVDADGISLYTFANDTKNASNCNGGCLSVWPPQHVPAKTTVLAPFGTIKGNDGKLQLTLGGHPLYHYDDDKKPGDAFGQYPKWDTIVVTP